MEKLSEEQIKDQMEGITGWIRTDEKWLQKKYRFQQFLTGVDFVRQIADIAEELDHHPMISIDYKLITIKLTTWNSGGLTELDFTSAIKYDQIYKNKAK